MATSLLISRLPVRVHELERLSHHIGSQGTVSFVELATRFAIQRNSTMLQGSALLKELLGFLMTLELIQSSAEKRWEDRSFTAPKLGSSFRLVLLSKLQLITDPRQRAFIGVYSELVRKGISYTSTRDLLALMESSDYADHFSWNDAKIAFWARFMTDIGLVVYVPPLRIAVSPSSDTLLRVIPLGEHLLRPLLEAIHHNYFAVFTSLGDVHKGVAHALLRVAKQNKIALEYQSDAAHSIVLNGQRLSRLRRSM